MIALNLTHVGASHIKVGKECQDFSLSESNEKCSVAITCDGHGGDNYFRSALGSTFAAQAAFTCISELMDGIGQGFRPKDPETMLVQLEKSVITRWNAAVWEHFEKHPFTQEELDSVSEGRRKRLLAGESIESTYGTTLIALVQTENFWFGIQIGDGKCVRIKLDGTFDMPIPANDKCFLNSTTSICDENAIEDFRHYYTQDLPVASFCGSDGIDDSFVKKEQLYKLYATIARSFGSNEYDIAKAELEDYMPRLSSKGSGDDVSIAGIIDKEHVIEAIGEGESPSSSTNQQSSASTGEDVGVAHESTGLSWICPKCGNHNFSNYCSECGTQKPSHLETGISGVLADQAGESAAEVEEAVEPITDLYEESKPPASLPKVEETAAAHVGSFEGSETQYEPPVVIEEQKPDALESGYQLSCAGAESMDASVLPPSENETADVAALSDEGPSGENPTEAATECE